MKKDILARLMYALWSIYFIVSGFTLNQSMSFFMLKNEGLEGYFVLTIAGIILILLLSDVIINDIMPDKYSCLLLIKHRHYIYTLSSLLFLMPIFCAAKINTIDMHQWALYIGASLSGWILGIRDIARRSIKWAT